MQTRKFAAFVIPAIAACGLTLPVSTGLAKQPSSQPEKQMMTARWTDKAPRIDGVMGPGEWSAAIPVHVNFVKPSTAPGVVEAGFENPDNPHDLSFTIRAVYDADNLYVAVAVADDFLAVGPLAWESDAVEIFVDGDRVNGCPPPDDGILAYYGIYDIWQDCTPQTGLNDFFNWDNWAAYAYGGADESIWRVGGEEGFQLITDFQGTAWSWYSPAALGLEWTSAAGLHPRGYVVEWSIALDSIDTQDGPDHRRPEPGEVIGFDIAVDDCDGFARDTQGWWEGRATGSTYAHEDEWGTLYFEPQPKGKAR